MGLREQLTDDLKTGMRRQAETRKRAIRLVIAAIQLAETELGASRPQDMDKVMKPLLARLRGKAEGQLVNQVARALLAE